MRTALVMWAGNEIARRWRALVALGVLAGLAGGLAIAAVAGARRTATAYERFREATGRSDAMVFGTLIGVFDADYGPIRALPEVEDAGEFTLAPIFLEGLEAGQLAPNDDRLYRTVNRPLLVAGRLPDPRRPDELVINRKAASAYGLRVGDRVRMSAGLELFGTGDPGAGPSVDATVVGIGDSAMELAFQGDSPAFTPSAAFLAQHPEVPRAGNLVVRLRPGTDVAGFARRAAEVMGLPNLPVRDQAEDIKRVTHGTDLERTALLLFSAAVALAAVVLVGQALSRVVFGIAEAGAALRGLGFTRQALVAGLVLPLGASAATAAAAAAGTAVALSRWFPLGLAGRLEPDRGVHADWLVVVPGATAVALLALAGAAVAALRATSPGRRTSTTSPGSRLAPVLARVAPLPAVIGAGLALRRGEGERALPVRPAIASGVAAVLGVVGAFGLLRGIDDALVRPERAGQTWDAELVPAGVDNLVAGVPPELRSDPAVSELAAVARVNVDLQHASIPIYSLRAVRGAWQFTMLEGRSPAAADEIVLGPATAKGLGRDVGDNLEVEGAAGSLRVVGIALLPQTPHFSFDQGAWVTSAGFDALAPTGDDASPREETVLVRFQPGAPLADRVAEAEERLGHLFDVEPSVIPQDVEYLRNVRQLPTALAVFLVLLGVGALAHVLATTVRRRGHDLAVLRALGFRPLQAAACVSWQAVTVSAVALLIGIPLGIAAGRWSWRWVADSTPLVYVPPVAATVALLAVPAALVLANLISALPARRAARLRPAEVLRAE
ncbi:MAG TPA: ABC transporter permease [Acidimicrobiales bacterium]|nr:ABC transporter permease [Acidimicrobiales bacterium]